MRGDSSGEGEEKKNGGAELHIEPVRKRLFTPLVERNKEGEWVYIGR